MSRAATDNRVGVTFDTIWKIATIVFLAGAFYMKLDAIEQRVTRMERTIDAWTEIRK